MQFATGAMSSLLPKLGGLLLEEYDVQKGLKKEIKDLRDELLTIEAALVKVSHVPLDQLDPVVKIWANDVREMSYAIEDSLDSFLVRVEEKPHTFLGFIKKTSKKVTKLKIRREIASDIKDAKIQVKKVKERYDRYKDVIGNTVTKTEVGPRLWSMYNKVSDLVGIDKAMEELMELLSNHRDVSELKTMSIVGLGGLGKTTLAKAVYDKLNKKFDCAGFVPVGQNPEIKKVLKDILLAFDVKMHDSTPTMDERQLIDQLRKFLANKRYLIIVDDIWDSSTWETIKLAFVGGACGSSVIITTRNFTVAQTAGEVYKLKPLSHAKSEELFYERLDGGKDKIPDELVEITQSIIKKCDGIPLAIITVASLLVGRPLQEWTRVYNSFGFGHIDDRDLQNTRNISLMSYYDLPSHLKTCLVHLSIFPEGYMIRKDTLIWKWIAQGFVGEEREIPLFALGESFFNELINRSLVQPVEIPHSGIIIGCHVNVMVLDMICFLAREENFVTILDSHKQDTSDMHQARLLAIQNSVVKKGFVQENEMLAKQHVRSFNATKCEFQMMPSLASFKLVRVLALEDCASIGGIYHLEHIKKLVLLRYLGLLNTPICELPEGIDKLEFLETLDLRQTKIKKLPQWNCSAKATYVLTYWQQIHNSTRWYGQPGITRRATVE